jgi:uncharacterized protein YegP (UPF0339 family)
MALARRTYALLRDSVAREITRAGESASAYRFVVFRDQAGAYSWRFLAPNGRVVAVSGEGYRNEADCKSAISVLCREAKSGTPIEFDPSAG